MALTSADGYTQLLSNLGPDPMEKSLKLVTLGPRLPRFLQWILVKLIFHVLKDFIFADILGELHRLQRLPRGVSKRKTAGQLWNAIHERDEFVKQFRKAVRHGVGATLTPGLGGQQVRLPPMSRSSCPSPRARTYGRSLTSVHRNRTLQRG